MESPHPQQSSPVCTFIVRSRKQPLSSSFSSTSRPLSKIHSRLDSSPDYSSSHSPHSVAFDDRVVALDGPSSSGTFGGFPNLKYSQMLDIPAQRSPNPQSAPPVLSSTPMLACFSDSSGDGSALRTPIDFLSEMARTGELSASDTRASLFTISAYNRLDNMKTPMADSDQAMHELNKPLIDSTRRVSFMDVGPHVPAARSNPAMIPSNSISSLRRAHRPAPLTLSPDTANISHLVVPRNVSQARGGSTDHIDSGHSSAVEEIPVYRVVEHEMQRYNQKSTVPSLPVVEFVKRVCVELRIDQEEHRTLRPKFIFKRHIAKQTTRPRNESLRPSTATRGPEAFWNNVTSTGLVDFRMSAREIGTFHCGKIAREAILRRVVLDGDDQKDHLTVNVVLPLKDNGVYTVHGVERERKRVNPKLLVWKFEYTVEDKRLHQTGQLVTGEKLLRPISFICSPELLLPSQASDVTIMHLLSKKLKPSPTATRIPPPAMPPVLPPSATSAISEYSFNIEPGSSTSRRRMSRIGTAVKTLSRPTTPATDRRLRDRLDAENPTFGFSRRGPVARSFKSETKKPGAIGDSQKPLSLPSSRRVSSYKHTTSDNSPLLHSLSSNISQKQKWELNLGKSADSLPLPSARRPYTTESSPHRSRTAGFAFGKSLKHMSSAFAGKMGSINRPATAGSQPSDLKAGPFRTENFVFHTPRQPPGFGSGRKAMLPLSHNGDVGQSVTHPLWRIPTDEEMYQMLESARGFVAAQQQRLEILDRSRGSSKDVSIEQLDSFGDITVQSDNSSGPPPQKYQHHFTGQRIASPRILESWTSPGRNTRRPSTANGVVSESSMNPPLAGRSFSQATLKRPHTSDGPNQDHTWPSSYPWSRNGSTISLGLPYPPRKPRSSLGKMA